MNPVEKTHCPRCRTPQTYPELTTFSVVVDACPKCQGRWLDRGEVSRIIRSKDSLSKYETLGLKKARPSLLECPRCSLGDRKVPMRAGGFPGFGVEVDECSECLGLWFDGHEWQKILSGQPRRARPKALPPLSWVGSLGPTTFESMSVLLGMTFFVYRIAFESFQMDLKLAWVALITQTALLYLLSPWILDLSLGWFRSLDWVDVNYFDRNTRNFLIQSFGDRKTGLPKIWGLGIVDGGFGAFTYGRFPGDVRLVVSRGVVKNLSADELQAVLAHEMGHIFRWDFAIMTVAQLIPAILKTLIE